MDWHWDHRRAAKIRFLKSRRFLFLLSTKFRVIWTLLLRPERHWRMITGPKGRVCYSPDDQLRKLQSKIASGLGIRWFSRECLSATAWNEGCSIVENAKLHAENLSSLSLDLRNAFESIQAKHIARVLERDFSLDRDSAWVVSKLLTFRGRLRQGAPVSPMVFNVMLRRFDREIVESLPDLIYSRYGDDLCFSSSRSSFPESAKEKIRELIRSTGLSMNDSKTKEGRDGILEFPGVVVRGKRIIPNRDYFERVRIAAHYGMSKEQIDGHRSFLRQFPRSGRRYAKQTLKAETPTSVLY